MSVIEIGTERHSPPKPHLKLEKWQGEVSLKVGIPFETGEKPVVIGNKIRYSTADKPLVQNIWWQKILSNFSVSAQDSQPKVAIDFYPKRPLPPLHQSGKPASLLLPQTQAHPQKSS